MRCGYRSDKKECSGMLISVCHPVHIKSGLRVNALFCCKERLAVATSCWIMRLGSIGAPSMAIQCALLSVSLIVLTVVLSSEAVHDGPIDDESSLYNDTIISRDISRVSLRKLVSTQLANFTRFTVVFNSPAAARVRDDANLMSNDIHMQHSHDVRDDVLSTSGPAFICKETEKQLVVVEKGTAKVCCNSNLDITRSCSSHRCAVNSRSCCISEHNGREFCPGLSLFPSGSGGQRGIFEFLGGGTAGAPLPCRFGPTDVRIDLGTKQARACCISTSPCGGFFPCSTIFKRTYRRMNRIEYCCEASPNSMLFCSPNIGGTQQPPPLPPPQPSQKQVVYPQPVYPQPQPELQPQPVYPQPQPQPVAPAPCLYTRLGTSDRLELLNSKIQGTALMMRDRLNQSLVPELNQLMHSMGNRVASAIVQRSVGPFKHYLDS